MWGYSFEDLARRAQEEAAKLAEHASSTITSPGLFSLDDLNPDKEQSSNNYSSTTPTTSTTSATNYSAAAAATSTSFYRPFFTDPTLTKKDALSSEENDDGENLGRSWSNNDNHHIITDHISSFVSKDYNYSPKQHKLHSKKITTTPSVRNSETSTTTAAAAADTTTKTPSVKELQIPSEDTDEFNFDSWGEEETYIEDEEEEEENKSFGIEHNNYISSEQYAKQPHVMELQRFAAAENETSRKAGVETELLREERLAATRIELEQQREQERIAVEMEERRLEQERLAAEVEDATVATERLMTERLAAEEREARSEIERLEEERVKAEEEQARVEIERIAQERLVAEEEQFRVDAELTEQERLAAEEEQARVEIERKAQERLAAEEEQARVEAERIAQERRAAEDEAARVDAERIEQERLAAEEEQARVEIERMAQERLVEKEEKARLEVERLEQERRAAEDEAASVVAENETPAVEDEAAKVEAERREHLDAGEAEARFEAKRFAQERLVCEADEAKRFEYARLAGEEGEAKFDAEHIDQETEQERIAANSNAPCRQEFPMVTDTVDFPTSAVVEQEGDDDMGDVYGDEELDDMYDDDDDNDDSSHPESEKVLEQVLEVSDQSTCDKEIAAGTEPSESADEPTVSPGPTSSDESFLNVAAAATSTSMQSMFDSSKIFEASKSAALYSWGYGGSSDNLDDQVNVVLAEEDAFNSIVETESCHEVEERNTPLVQQVAVISATPSLDQESVPPNMLDNFVKQLERMTESHQLEMDEMQRTHKIEIDRLNSELFSEREMKKKVKVRDEVASQDKHLKQMRELEKKFNDVLNGKEEELRVAVRRNEGMGLQIETMKREVSGLSKIVDERDDEICRLKQGHGNTMMQVESGKDEMARKDSEINELRAELRTTTDAYNTLKARAKAVATELKDRRIEVRNLSSQLEELESSNASFDMQLSNLRSIIKQHELTIGYKDKDMESLNEQINELKKQIAKGNDKSVQDRSVGEKAIASYKRKAQEALAAANSRLAAANQSREEAESDAKNARSASDDAVERARVAEMMKSEAEKKAAVVSGQLESERTAASRSMDELRVTIENLQETVNSLQIQLKDTTNIKEKFAAELERLHSSLAEYKDKTAGLREQLIESNTRCESLQREVFDLTDEVQRSSAAAFKFARDSGEAIIKDNHIVSGSTINRGESDGTIILLQQELQGANEAIEELKLALRSALLENVNNVGARDGNITGAEAGATHNEHGHEGGAFTSRNDSTPLYFAIEKQNELKTARDEINRLANMVGEAESDKQDAYDAMKEMRQRMEEATSRLLRYEKLGVNSSVRPQISHSSYGPSFRNTSPSLANDSAVNLEYLKNVMLSFLTAKTLAERRKLVPVVATVLCLTPEEQTQAINSVEQSTGLTGVASSFWEHLESKAHSLL